MTVHPFDPWGTKIGGIESFIRTLFKYAPDDFDMRLVGVTEDPFVRPVRKWHYLDYENRPVAFYPVLTDLHPNQRSLIPLFFRFPLLLNWVNLGDRNAFYLYHRIEPLAFASLHSQKNMLCIHGNPDEITGKSSEVKWRYTPWLYRIAEKYAVNKSHRTWVVSRLGETVLAERHPNLKERFAFLPTWYRDDIFRSASKEEKEYQRKIVTEQFQAPPASRFILFASRWEEQKNPILALESFNQIAAKYKNLYLIMVGTGGLNSKIKNKILQMNLGSRVKLAGMQTPSQLSAIMQGCDLFLLSSQFEGLPIVMLEAQASGLPVVSTDTGELKKVIRQGRTGRIVSAMNATSLAEGIEDVLDHPEHYHGEACANAVEDYRPKAILPWYFDEIRKIAGAEI